MSRLPKVHLGCGQQRLEGYINVDYPLEHHTVQTTTVADLHSDIRTMEVLHGSVSEVRLHHVLEHFPRVEALALLMRWNRWLCEGGTLIVETPDFGRSISLLSWPWCSDARRWRVMRHIFGSQEAAWAYHYEGWSKHSFRRVLTKLGYGQLCFEVNSWKDTRNITVRAIKLHKLSPEQWRSAAEDLLRDYLIDDSDTEQRMLEAWMQQFDRFQSEAKLESLELHGSS